MLFRLENHVLCLKLSKDIYFSQDQIICLLSIIQIVLNRFTTVVATFMATRVGQDMLIVREHLISIL